MKTLHQSLIDYNLSQLQAIADCHGVALETVNRVKAVELLTNALLSPAAVAITLTTLSEPEQDALQLLLANGGQIESPRIIRQYGPVRPMGPARMAREKPWQNPVNPTEGLWYKGLICKSFQLTDQGSLEFFYIPNDLLPLLQSAFSAPQAVTNDQQPTLPVAQTPAPAVIVSGEGRLRENIFNLLVYLQTTPVRLHHKTDLTTKDKSILADLLLPPLFSNFIPQTELDFLLHLAQRAGLLIVSHGRLRPDRDPTRAWLQAHSTQQERVLQDTWRADPTWNDLWHVPGLVPQPTGWENSPLLARAKILEYLAQLDTSSENWLSLADFTAAIKRLDPDFQRPSGDYERWYIQDEQGNSLMGFEHWDTVEGALIRYILTHLLPLLGVVNLGLPTETSSSPTCFQITTLGAAFLAGQPTTPVPEHKPRFLQVDNSFNVNVPSQASLYDRFQLTRFAELQQQGKDRPTYRITQASVGRAMRNGVTADQIVAFLARATNNRTPLKVVETLRNWGARRSTIELERATLLRLTDESLVMELQQHSELGPLLGEVIGPKAILVPADNVNEVRRLLTELGFLEF
jgi:hypothetical protein